ncbi:MAG TPA: hypothetical protein VKZ65_02030 [Glycomyces sp.]|nr:hypothetical protein [Glycomyces sp.]
MGSIRRGRESARRIDVPRLLLRTALAALGSLLLGALCAATAAWASDETVEATGLAALTDPLVAEVSETSRLAARLVPHNQQGHRTPPAEGASTGLVSGLTAPVGSLIEGQADAVQATLHADTRSEPSNGESAGDRAAEVVTPLLGTLIEGTSSIVQSPAPAASSVYKTLAPATDEVEVLARLVTDGLVPPSEATTPGSVLADGRVQPGITALQQDTDPTEAVAALPGAPDDRSAVGLECAAAPGGAQPAEPDDARKRVSKADTEQPRTEPGPALPDLKTIPGGAAGSSTGVSVDGGHAAVDVSSSTDGEQVSFARAVVRGLGRPMDRAAELSVAPD